MRYVTDPAKSAHIDAYMGDMTRHVSRPIQDGLEKAIQAHPEITGDLAVLASATILAFEALFGASGVEAILRTRTVQAHVRERTDDRT